MPRKSIEGLQGYLRKVTYQASVTHAKSNTPIRVTAQLHIHAYLGVDPAWGYPDLSNTL